MLIASGGRHSHPPLLPLSPHPKGPRPLHNIDCCWFSRRISFFSLSVSDGIVAHTNVKTPTEIPLSQRAKLLVTGSVSERASRQPFLSVSIHVACIKSSAHGDIFGSSQVIVNEHHTVCSAQATSIVHVGNNTAPIRGQVWRSTAVLPSTRHLFSLKCSGT